MRAIVNDTFLKFVIGFFGIILASFSLTVVLDHAGGKHDVETSASVRQPASVIMSVLLGVDAW